MKYTAQKQIGNEIINVTIRLDDECNNGHQDFSITGELYKETNSTRYLKRKDGKRYALESCGCIHEEVLRFFPKFKPFVDLHLCDIDGIPMHAVSNGYYHLKHGFSGNNESFESKFCEFYNVSATQFKKLKEATSEVKYSILLEVVGAYKDWELLANEAKQTLEKLIKPYN